MLSCFLLVICVVLTQSQTQVLTRVAELEINLAANINSDNLIVISGLNVYRDDLVLLDTYSGMISVHTNNLTVAVEYFDRINITHVYSAVDDVTGVAALCTNKRGRCQYMNVTTLSVLGYGDNLILPGEQDEAVDVGVLVLLADTNTNIPSLFTASGNAVTIGKSTSNPEYPIVTAQLMSPLLETADLVGQAQSSTFVRRFIATFKSERFVYIVTEDGGTNIRITRICEDDTLSDTKFHSLYQTTLTPCGVTGAIFVIGVSMSVLSNGEYVVVTYESVGNVYVCAYSLSSINQAMTDTYQTCVVDGQGIIPQVTLFDALLNLQCSDYGNNTMTFPECNIWSIGTSVKDPLSLETADVTGTLITNTIEKVTTITTSVTDSGNTYYYMYITQGNNIDKYLMSGLSLTEPALERLTFSERITGVKADQSGDRLFAITNSRLLRIPVSDCERHETCDQCVSDRDPLCGWCSVQNSCLRQSLCDNSLLTYRWIADDVTTCLSVTAISPNSSNINIGTNVTISAVNLPELDATESYVCMFDTLSTQVTAVNSNSSLIRGPVNGTADIQCPVPIGLSAFTQSDSRVYSLSLRAETYSADLSDTSFNYTIVDCGYNRNCTSCTESVSECGWCLYDSVCTADNTNCYMQEWVQPSDDSTLCPRIDSISADSTLIPALEESNVTLTGTNLPEPTTVYNYTCQLILMGSTTVVTADWYNNTDNTANISCVIEQNVIPIDVTGSVQVIWGESYTLRQDNELSFTTFVCGNQPDCKTCLINPGCSWCYDDTTGNCSSECANGMIRITDSLSCPQPVITEFSPTTTAVGGIVELTINGQNLKVVDRPVSVEIGDTVCGVTSHSNNQIICSLQTPANSLSDPLNVTVDGENTTSNVTFMTLTPDITSVYPGYAPQYGGSVITVTGTNLGIGSSRTLTAEMECSITSQTDYVITCITSRYEGIVTPLMTVTVDQIEESYQDEFIVLEDPQVTDVFLSGTDTRLREVTASGVLDYELRGSNLGATVTQTLKFYSEDKLISTSICTPPDSPTSQTLTCPGSAFNTTGNIPDSGLVVRFELVMDQVPNVTQPYFTVFKTFLLYPDPMLPTDSSMIELTEGEESLLIKIPNINRLPLEVISVRERLNSTRELCSSIFYSDEGITCTLNTSKTGQFDIEVLIGQNANSYAINVTLIIVEKSGIVKFLETNIVGVIIVAVLILVCLFVIALLLCLCCCCLYRARRSNRLKQEEAEHLLNEMEDIENDLAEKCRKGFAELNTQIEQDEGILEVGKIPVHNFKMFAMHILFPGLHDHPVLHPVEKPRNHDTSVFNTGLHKFEGLLHDKQFLAVMLHAMEDNPSFSVRDRCNVASLLTVALYTDMPYLTEVLFELLGELINRHVTRNTSKLLLRRTESVAEKLLADWLAFNLYHHLQRQPSRVMYRMFLGIKGHLESGPVDVLSGRSANSLSEEKLMRQNVSHAKLDVEAESLDGSKVPCRLLDCDTITQAKIKLMDHIYRGVGYSQRPKIEDVEVELKSPGGGRLQLRDNDMTNEGDDDCRQINTLLHYNIAAGMTLTVVPRKQRPNPGQVWDYPGTSIYDFGHTQTLSCLLSLDEDRTQVFHLQKKEEGEYYEQTKTLRRRQYGSEIFLPKLVATKRILQSYMDQTFDEIFPDKTKEVPKAIKVLFDFLDNQAEQYSIEEDDVTHTWKSNSLPLRFWVNLIKNPEFLLDVAKSASHDAALSVISQAFIDSCSTGESKVSRESPTNKILYHKEVQGYKTRVKDYYKHIKDEPKVDRNSLTFQSTDLLSEGEDKLFYVESAAYGLFSYAQSYQEEIKTRLCNDSLDSQQKTFEEVCCDISENLYMA